MVQSPLLAQLRKALATLTVKDFDSSTQDSLWCALYYAASQEGTFLPTMFPDTDPSNFPKSWDDATSPSHRISFYKSKKENFTHVGRNCGRKFRKGEPIYRCMDCSFDHTCVLCVHCFNKEDHIGHQVNASICNNANNTGICDCGDPEAWKRELHCKCNSKVDEYSEDTGVFNQDYESFLQMVYSICLDFIIEVFAHQNQTLPVINEKLRGLVTRSGNRYEAIEILQRDIDTPVLSYEKYGVRQPPSKHCVVLWNDEFHNFHEAQTAIIGATNDSRVGAKQVATAVDKEGRTILVEGSELETIAPGFANVQFNGLTASIMSKGDFLRQDHSKTIIDWVLDSINFPNTGFQKIARRALCKSLCSKYNSDDIKDTVWNSLYSKTSGLLNGKHLPNVNHELIDFTKSDAHPSTTLSNISKISTALPLESRMQYLLFFDLRYWKSLRKKIHDLLIPTLVSDLEYKAIAANQIVEIYGLLINNLSQLDREPHINALDEISCQFFTCPTNSSNIIGTEHIREVLYPVSHLFEAHIKQSNASSSEVKRFKIPHRILDKSTSIRKSFTRSINDLTYMFEKATSLSNFFHLDNFIPFCYLLRLFDSNWEIQRKVGEHVETETYDFVDYFSYTLQLLGVVYAASDATKLSPLDEDLVSKAIQKLLHLMALQPEYDTKVFKSFELIDFEVSKEYTGFLNPSNVFLSRLLQIATKSSKDVSKAVSGFDFLKSVDSSLRAIVLCAQIESQFWVRNGLNSLKQAYTYKSPQLLHDTAYYRDVHLTQLVLLSTDPEKGFLNILNRFELLDWFSNKMQLDNTVYEDKVYTILEKLIAFLYILISERSLFMEFESRDKEIRHRLKQVLIYTLYCKPLSYSEIEESLSEEMAEYTGLDEVLNEVTIFSAPRGLNDDGRYALRPELFKLVDPLKMLAQNRDFQDNTTIISKALAEQSEKSLDDTILEPKLAKLESFKTLGDFTRTSEFAKFVYKLLEYAIQNNRESYVPQLLHLLHAVFKDDEMVNGKDHIIESFVQIPVCESLFSIANSVDFSKQSTKKADFLLEILIVKNSRLFFDALLSCFGENAVNIYKENKKSTGVNFDESEPERKRRIAKERQKKIMEKMSKKQKLFIEKNDTESPGEETEGSIAPEDMRHCVLCQAPETPEELFGIPASFIKSNVFRALPRNDKHFVQRAFKNWGDDCVNYNAEAVGLGFPLFEKSTNYTSCTISTSCNHGMHFKCLESFMREHNHTTPSFACPLCKTFHNNFLPVLTPKNTSEPGSLGYGEELVFDAIAEKLLPALSDAYQSEYDKAMKIVLGRDFEQADSKLIYLPKIMHIFSSSIFQSEIATRINGTSSYRDFLTQIPEQTFRVLRGMFQGLMVFQKINQLEKKDLQIGHDLEFLYQLVAAFFTGHNDFRSLIIQLLNRDAKQCLAELLFRSSEFGDFPVELEYEEMNLDKNEALGDFVHGMERPPPNAKERFLNDSYFASKLFQMTKKILLPQVRSLCIFYKVVFPNFTLNNVDDFKADDIDMLLTNLELPRLFNIMVDRPKLGYIENVILKPNSLKLHYPGVIKLVDLPKELSFFTTSTNDTSLENSKRFKPESDVQNSTNRIDFSVCLTCGTKVFKNDERNEKLAHMRSGGCDSGPDALYLTPNTDVVNLMSSTIAGHFSKVVNAPYLNTHGQSGAKAVQNGQIAILNSERYKYLNNLWLTGSIFSYLSRNSSPVLPRFGLDAIGEERFWQQFLTNARADLEVQNQDDDQPFVFTFPPGANYVDEFRGPGLGDEDNDEESSEGESDEMEDEDEDFEGFGFFNENELEERELDHFEDLDEDLMSEDEFMVSGELDDFETADEIEVEHFGSDSDPEPYNEDHW